MISELLIQLNQLIQKRIVRNLMALGFLQLTNYLVPLIIIPFIIQKIGIEKFGVISVAQAVIMFFVVATEYGFSFTSTRDISLVRTDHHRVSQIYSRTLWTKTVLGIAGFIILVAGITVFIKSPDYALFCGAYLMVVGQLLFPTWLFQGLERMKFITYLNVVAKSITLALILVLVRNEDDYLWVLPSYGLGNLVASIASAIIVRIYFEIRFQWVTFVEVRREIISGFSLFASNLSVTLYNLCSVLILQLFASDRVVGYYSAAEKVSLVVRQVLGIISQAIYPHLCRLTENGFDEVFKFWKKIIPLLLAGVALLCVALFVFAQDISFFLIGSPSPETTHLIRWLAFVPLIVSANIPAFQTLIAFNLRNEYMRVLIAASVFNIIINFVLSYFFQATGTVVALLLTEILISSGLILSLRNAAAKLNKPLDYGNL